MDRFNKNYVRKIVIIYAVCSTFWIFFSDHLVYLLFPNGFVYMSIYKGILFVLVTSLLLYILLLRFLKEIKLQHIKKDRALDELQKLKNDLENRVEERTYELKRSNETLEAFAYSISHDLKAPLRAVTGFAKILEEDYGDKLDEEGKRVLTVIKDNVAKMDTLINDILTLSRVQRAKVEFIEIDVNHLVRDILEQLANIYVFSKYHIQVNPLTNCYGDAILLKQVFYNLIENALKYSSKVDSPKIEIGSYVEGDWVVYYVRDNGVGFDSQYKHKLFTLFQRLHQSSQFSGTGVGLAIVKNILQRHGGDVWAEGEKDKGATFYFKLKKR
ncbi:MAG: ATP-binding protein [Calditerrivibrio sp.]|nr:ATP-binding protein [Calditerrivibrio sp.]